MRILCNYTIIFLNRRNSPAYIRDTEGFQISSSRREIAMVQLIVGKKGKGKTKALLDHVNAAIKEANGNIVYIDKSSKHMFELNNKIRLIDASIFPLKNSDEFVGFLCGILSQDHDLEDMYLDSFLKVAKLEDSHDTIDDCLTQLEAISQQFHVNFILSVSMDKEELTPLAQEKVLIAL